MSPADIQLAVTQTLNASESCSYNINEREVGKISVELCREDWYMTVFSEFRDIRSNYVFRIERDSPMICMYFQYEGISSFVDKERIVIPTQTHSLNFLPEVRSDYYVEDGSSSVQLSIKLDPSSFVDHLRSIGAEDEYEKFRQQRDPFISMQHGEKINPHIRQAVYDFQHCPYKGRLAGFYRENIIRSLLLHQLAVFCGNVHSNNEPGRKLLKRDVDLLHDIRNYLDAHYLEVDSLDRLARRFCINTFKLKHGFRKLFGTSVMKYIDDRKMDYARMQLQQTNAAIIDVADKLGYRHYNNFSTAFKRKFGYSPATVQR